MASTSDDHDRFISHQHQPIMLIRSDTIHPYQAITSPSSTITSKESGSMNQTSSPIQHHIEHQGKRKWDQVADGLSKKVPLHDHPTRPFITNDNNDSDNRKNSNNEKVVKDDVSQDSDGQHSSSSSLNGKKPGRKPLADDELSDDDEDPKVKRKAQNRMAQRNFRERREKYLRDLESKLKQAQDIHNLATARLYQENHHLRSIICRLENENVALKSIHVQHDALSGKPVQEWIQALHDHQQRFDNDPLAAILSSSSSSSIQAPDMVPLLPTTTASGSTTPNHSSPYASLPSSVGSPVSSERSTATPSTSTKQQIQYTFSISTPDTLRTRQKRQQQNRSPSPPSPSSTGSKQPQQLSPVELVRLYPHEHTTLTPATRAHSPASSSVSASTHGSTAQTPTMDCQVFCDKLQQEVCTNPFDQLLSEPLFNTTGGLNETLGLPHLNNRHPLINHAMDAAPHESEQPTRFLSGQEVWDRLHRHTRFNQYSSSQLVAMVKAMAKCTHHGPVLTEEEIKVILDKMDHSRV